jgi:UDP-N-acetylglucosamine 2-epimerase (non-hydrolysing)
VTACIYQQELKQMGLTAREHWSLDLVVGARPNLVKVAPLIRELQYEDQLKFRLVHTGQHYDNTMSNDFFDVLEIPHEHVNLEVGSSTHGKQTARIMERFEDCLMSKRPSMVVVFGDVNSTMACSLVSAKLGIPIAHVEAGLRSFDRSMPEEINRMVTDTLSDLLLASEPAGVVNLRNEGHPETAIRLVGNIMMDSLYRYLPVCSARNTYAQYGLTPGKYALLTLHRPSNVDTPETLRSLWTCFQELAKSIPIIFPAHPRTIQKLKELDLLLDKIPNLYVTGPVDYIDVLCLQKHAAFVMTDSGGIQEETSVLGVPCLTLRENTERPITISEGTSTLVGNSAECIWRTAQDILEGRYKKGKEITLWDGRTAPRVVSSIKEYFGRGAGRSC